MRILKNLSIRRKQTLIIMLTSSVVLLLACIAISIYEVVAFRHTMKQNLATLADIVAHNTTAALDFNDPKSAEETLSALQADPAIIGAWLYSKNGRSFAKYDRPNDHIIFTPPVILVNGTVFERHRLILCRPVVLNGETIGILYVETDMQALYARLNRYAGIVGFVFLVSLLIAFVLSSRLQRLISGPILHLVQITRSVAVEKNYSVRAVKQSDDELGQLVDGFNEMLVQIQLRELALKTARNHLEERVRERTAELAKANEAVFESQALYHSLVEHLPAGVFRKDYEGRFVFVNSLFCRLKGRKAEEILGRTPRELATYESTLKGTTPAELTSQGKMASQGADHHETILRTSEVITQEEVYSHPDGTTQHFQAMKSPVFASDKKIIGTQGILFDITARKQAEIELAYERHLLRMLLDSSPDAVYFKDLESRFIKVGNAHAKAMGMTDANEIAGKTDFDFFAEEHARPALEDEQAIIRTGQPMIGKVEKEVLKGGRESWALTSKMPLRNKDGQIIGTFGISKDITAMKETEAKLEQVHKQLLETSRQAGMAEVATGVLHNVGNVLNSVNVASTWVTDSLKKSKVVNLSKVVALLREHEADLGAFLTNDPKGKQLPGYLAQLADHLVGEQAAMLKEIDGLQKNIEHIKDIVAMQQSYAKVSGVTETLKVTDLVEDALRMNASALERHEVQVIREFADLPPVTVDKHKVLQILVNLIRNAKYACDESGRPDRQMKVRITNGENRVRISIIDNGVGIPKENLVRIFNHGFTTRKEGHGFGLHSGALAARELGGALIAHSDGPGTGATFTIELPCGKN